MFDSGGAHTLYYAVAINEKTVITGNPQAQMRLIRQTCVTRLAELDIVGPASAFVAPNGEIYLGGGGGGTIWTLQLEPFSVTKIATASTSGSLVQLTGGLVENCDLELFALSHEGIF